MGCAGLINPYWYAATGPVLPITANLELWWRADSFVGFADDADVGDAGHHWIDQSVNARDGLTAGTPAKYKTNIVGTMPIVRFGDNIGLVFAPDISVAGDLSFFAALSVVDTKHTLVFNHNGANHQLSRNRSGNIASFYAGGSVLDSTAFGIASSSFGVVTWRRSGTTVSFRENQTARGTGVDANVLSINGIINNGFLGSGNADVGELIVYSSFLNDTDADTIYNYLKARWTTLP